MSLRQGTRHLILFVILVSILGMITAVSTSARQIEEPKHILVLNSYHE